MQQIKETLAYVTIQLYSQTELVKY